MTQGNNMENHKDQGLVEDTDPVLHIERDHLQVTLDQLKKALAEMSGTKHQIEVNRREQNRYLRDEMGAAPGDFLQAVEFSQTLQAEKQLLEQRGYQDQQQERYERLLNKPYFARIDYSEHAQRTVESIYIGYGNFMDPKTLDIYIYDWRTPIASIFYDFQTGPVHYLAPDGRISGYVHLKRQFDIQKQRLIAYYDTREHIADERLIEALADRTSGPMHQIVETLQAEQNRIIREKRAEVLFVEGVAGSGKTIVALHRIAYLLYHGLKNSLSAQNILVLSPNDLFSSYIAQVIPELGEEQVQTMTLGDVLSTVMQRSLPHRTPFQVLERQLLGEEEPLDQLATTLKQDPRMLKVMSDAMAHFEVHGIPSREFYYGTERLTTKVAMRKALATEARPRPLMKRLERFCERVRHKVKDIERKHYAELLLETMLSGQHPFDYKAVARLKRFLRYRDLSKALEETMAVDGLTVYQMLLNMPHLWVKYFPDQSESSIAKVCTYSLEAMQKGHLTLEDWTIVAGFQMALYGEHPLKQLKQIVVDESQDYSPVLYGLLRELFPKAHFTILGDPRQSMFSQMQDKHHQQIAALMDFEAPVYATLKVAYRNAQGIGAFCKKLFSEGEGFEIVQRPGEMPRRFTGPEALLEALSWMAPSDLQTIAILTKTQEEALQIRDILHEREIAVSVVEAESIMMPKGIVVMPIYCAKGMEFDGVVVTEVTAGRYVDQRDRQLLYIAASRALHRLAFTVSEGEESHWLTGAI